MDSIKNVLLELSGVLDRVDPLAPAQLAHEVAGANRVFVFGAGRSGYIMHSFAMRLAQLGLSARVIGEATAPMPGPGDLVIGLSGTGSTPSTLHVMKRGADAGATVLCITASPGSQVTKVAKKSIIVPGATKARSSHEPGSSQPLGSLFEQAAFIFLEAVAFELYVGTAKGPRLKHTAME